MPAGRPTKYDAKYNEQAKKLCLLGATDAEIANFFEVDEATINNWKIEHSEFFESIKEGRLLADANVGKRLYERACGFEHDDVDIRTCDGQIVLTPIRKIYPPDTTAAIFWLKNRRKADWREKQEVDHTTQGEKIEQKTIIVADNDTKKLLEELNQ